MATINAVELNSSNTNFRNREEAIVTLLNSTDPNVTLHIIDQKGLEDLKSEITTNLEEIDKNIQQEIGQQVGQEVGEAKKELEQADESNLQASKDHTDKRFEALDQKLQEGKTKLTAEITEIKKTIKNQGDKFEKDLNDKLDKAKDKLVDEILQTQSMVSANENKLIEIRRDMHFANNGSIYFAGLIEDKSSDEIVNMNDTKDTWLTNFVKGHFPNGPLNGYFVRCNDEKAFFYMNGKWYLGKSGGQTFSVQDPIKYDGGIISLAIDKDSGLDVNPQGALTFTPKDSVFEKFLKVDEDVIIRSEWSFTTPISSVEAVEGNQVPVLDQVKKLVKDGVDNIQIPQPITYTGSEAIEIDNQNKITLKVQDDSGLVIEANGLTFKPEENTQFSNFALLDEDENVTGTWTFTANPKATKEATEDDEYISKGQVDHLIKEAINGQQPQQPDVDLTGYTKTDVDETITANWTYNEPIKSIKKATEGTHLVNLEQVQELVKQADANQGQGQVTPDLSNYTQRNVDETIDNAWTYKVPPKSEQEATEETQLVNLKQVQELVKNGDGNTAGNTKEYTGEGAIEVDNASNKIKINVDEATGLKIVDGKLKFEGNIGNGGVAGGGNQGNVGGGGQTPGTGGDANNNNQNINLSEYPKKTGNESITGQWTFDKPIKLNNPATDDLDVPQFKQIKDEVTKIIGGGITAMPGFDKLLEEAEKEVSEVVQAGKNAITTQTTGHVTTLQQLGEQTENKITNLVKDADTKAEAIVKHAKDRILAESQAQQEAIAKVAESKMEEFRRITNPQEKETITFETLDKNATGRNNIVGFQKVIVDMSGKIIKYGDMMVKGGEANSYRADPNSIRPSRLNFPTNDIEFDRWTFNFISFAALPKRGQRANLHAMGYEGFGVDEDVDLDNVVFFLGNNDGGQFGTNNKDIYRRAVPIQFEDKIKQVQIEDWNQGGDSSAVQTLVLLENGKLFGSGKNDSGQFGLGNTTWLTQFKEIKQDVVEITSSIYGSVTFVKDKNGSYWKAGAVGYDFRDPSHAWRQITNNNCSKFHYISDWNGHRGYATELWFDNDKGMWMGRGNNDYGQRDPEAKNTNAEDQHNYLTLNRIRDRLLHVFNYAISMYALSATTLYSWGHRPYPFDSSTSKEVKESPLPLPGSEYELIQFEFGVTTVNYLTSLCLYYPKEHRMFYAGTIIGSFGLLENKTHARWTEIDLPPKRNQDSKIEIRYFNWNTNYQIAIILEGKLYLAGEGTPGSYISPRSTLFNEQQI